MDARKAQIKKDEKAAIDEARRVEREEKKAAKDMEKNALRAKTDKERLAAEEASETAFNAATEKAEAAILAAEQRSEDELSKALEQAEASKEAAAERAELLEKAAADKYEAALSQAAETAERAEKDAVFEEEAVEQQVVATVDAIEKEDLIEENASLEKAKEFFGSAWSVAAPLVIPGIFIALYAVLASFSAPPPEPCLGAEADEVRKIMGRAERPKTARANIDPWSREAKEMAKLGTGAMALLAVLMSSGPVSGFVSTSPTTLPARNAQRSQRTLSQGTPSQPAQPSATFGRATLAQGGCGCGCDCCCWPQACSQTHRTLVSGGPLCCKAQCDHWQGPVARDHLGSWSWWPAFGQSPEQRTHHQGDFAGAGGLSTSSRVSWVHLSPASTFVITILKLVDIHPGISTVSLWQPFGISTNHYQ